MRSSRRYTGNRLLAMLACSVITSCWTAVASAQQECPPFVGEGADAWSSRCPAAASALQECPRFFGEDAYDWNHRCQAGQSGENLAKVQAAVADLRAELEREPPLPAAKNPLLGRWMPQSAGEGGSIDLVSQLAGVLSGASCTMMFGEGAIEFRQQSMASIDGGQEENLGPVAYRGRGNMVFVLPEQRVRLMPFEINGPNQVTFTAGASPCTLLRVGAAAGQAASAAASAAAGQGAARAAAALAEKTGYRCPSGEQFYVHYCQGPADDAACSADRYDLPQVNGYPQNFFVPRGLLVQLLQQGCEAGEFREAADGSTVFAPGGT